MAPILNHHFRNFADEHIVFDYQYHGHSKPFGRDILYCISQLLRRNHGYSSPFGVSIRAYVYAP